MSITQNNQLIGSSSSILHHNPVTAYSHLDTNKKINKVLYAIVMPEESQILIEKFNFRKDEEFSNSHETLLETFVHKDQFRNLELIIVRPLNDPFNNTPLFGTEIAFLTTYLAAKHYDPDLIVSLGYAGSTGVKKDLKLGDIVLSKDCSLYFRRNMIIEYYQKTSMGLYPVYNCSKTSEALEFPLTLIGSSNSFVNHDEIACSKMIEVVEMELCSVARAAYYFKIPCVGIKIISDTSKNDELTDEKERANEFLKSLEIMREKILVAFEKFNEFLVEKKLGEL
jgi:hypothetical protein